MRTRLPLIMTHGWPGSVFELLDTVGPLTDPTAHGGNPEDAFHLVLPSLPGYGFSSEPAELGWDAGRTARAWAQLMNRLGYTRYVAQGGDVGALVTDLMGRQAVEGLVGYHLNLLTAVLAIGDHLPRGIRQGTRSGRGGCGVQAGRLRLLPRDGHAAADDRLLRCWIHPSRLAAWLLDHDTDSYYKIARAFVDGAPVGNLTRDNIIDNITLYWLTGTGSVGGPVVLGRRTSAGRSACERPGSSGGLGSGRVHDVPRRDLGHPAQLGRGGLPRPRLLQRGRQGRPLRRLGRAAALHDRVACCIQLTALRRTVCRSASRRHRRCHRGVMGTEGTSARSDAHGRRCAGVARRARRRPAERRRGRFRPTTSGGCGSTRRPITGDCRSGRWSRPAAGRDALLRSGLSEAAYVTATTIIGLENVLDAVESWRSTFDRRAGRTRGCTTSACSASPAPAATWGWRFGGHHVSVNHTVVDGELAASTPCFLGADPAHSPLLGPHLLRPLGGAEDLGRELVRSLDAGQLDRALLSPGRAGRPRHGQPPQASEGDRPLPLPAIFRGALDGELGEQMARGQAAMEEAIGLRAEHLDALSLTKVPKGLRAAELRGGQRDLLRQLLDVYVRAGPRRADRRRVGEVRR